MKVGGEVVADGPRAAALPTVLLSRSRATFRCYSFSSSDHVSFVKDVAATQPPQNLPHLLKMLRVRGKALIENLICSEIVLKLTLLRWPTAPPGMDMPVVEVHKHGVLLLAENASWTWLVAGAPV